MTSTVGPIIFDLLGTELSAEEREMLQHPLTGGVIFFKHNYESPEQIKELCRTIRQATHKPLLLTVDHEGGRVQRFREGFTRLPSMDEIGKFYDRSPEEAVQLAKNCGWLMAAELLEVGIDLSFAPVLDIDHGVSTVIGDRAFHRQSDVVILLTQAFTQGMQEAGMASVGKHFPGHGSVHIDSHLDLPVDQRTFEEVAKEDLVPFSRLIASGIQGVMAAHILYPAIDERAVGFSPHWIKTVLREQLKFSGTVFSDDLCMEGAKIAGGFPDRVQAALEAGCDFASISHLRESVVKTLDGLSQQRFQVAKDKLERMQGNFTRIPTALKQSKIWHEKHHFLTHNLTMGS